MEISPGVHWLRAGYANVFLLVEEEGLTLVDSGVPRQAKKIVKRIRALGREPAELRRVLITHADFDHAGSAAALHQETGALVMAAEATLEHLRQGCAPRHIRGPLGIMGDLVNRFPRVPDEALVAVEAGSVLPVFGGLMMLASPGHTPDHHSFFSPKRGILFSGDALGVSDGRLNVPPSFITADMEAAKQSALQLLQLAPMTLACGHGEPLRVARSDKIRELIQSLEQ